MISNLLTKSNFTGRYIIPLTVEATFNSTITEIQYETLIDLMGYPIYQEFEDGLAEVVIPAKWSNLRDGVEYTDYSGDLNNWRGLIYMLVPFVWCAYVQNEAYRTSQIGGLHSSAPKNSIIASEYQLKHKLHQFQNEAIKRYNEAYLFMYTNLNDYLDFTTFFKEKYFSQILTKSSIL